MNETANATGLVVNDHRPPHLLKRFWFTAIRFWHRKEGSRAWLLSGGLLLIIVLLLVQRMR
jgi:ABC-type uncharacterized transport system fused permease/ATPase subunit